MAPGSRAPARLAPDASSAAVPAAAPDAAGAATSGRSVLLHVEGMHCGHCTAAVERALQDVPGVDHASVDLESKLATVQGDARPDALVKAVDAIGKKAKLLEETVLRVDGMMCGHWCDLRDSNAGSRGAHGTPRVPSPDPPRAQHRLRRARPSRRCWRRRRHCRPGEQDGHCPRQRARRSAD